ncbi:hypothetical protein LPJ64_002605 [Coemansia asiatica]|uniref:Transmembrane protein 188 n=1 Tax=Coemansia asiatica TaxID=1052880 RepID=A0A9W8CKW1_9FUNG|nr:hypothetical protein LPJ64_002605 [Coemansia asiatica]KAJ2884863.1 hypothetical protein FB639_001882 [Coemansia asiatica]
MSSSARNRIGSNGGMASTMQAQDLLSPHELARMYTQQFAVSKSAVLPPTIYQAASAAAVPTADQTYVHGLSVLQCARSRAPVDPHVYRDWLIFEERLKQSYRRLQRKKRNYFVQILAFGILSIYFAWFGIFGTKNYRFTCKLLSAGSAYCIYLIVKNRRFLQSIKYPTQCNRSLHQFRMRFETSPLQAANPFAAAATSVEADNNNNNISNRNSSSTIGVPLETSDSVSKTENAPAAQGKTPGYLAESQLAFFPTVPRQLRDGYMEFKNTYYRKRDAAKKRMQERMQREKRRKSSISNAGPRSSERKTRHRSQRHQHQYQHLRDVGSSHEEDSRSSNASTSIRGRMTSTASTGGTMSVIDRVSATTLATTGLSSLLAGGDSATDDGSATSSSFVSRKPNSSPLSSKNRPKHAGSNLIHSLPEQDTSSDSDVPDGEIQ